MLKVFHCLRSWAVNKTFLLAQQEANVGGSGVGVQMLRGQVVWAESYWSLGEGSLV